jgi:hypothetical protein
MGNKSEMLVAVRAPEGKQGPIQVTLTTDLAAEAFLHWGVRRGASSDWLAPPDSILPPESARVEDNAAAVDTPFLDSNDPETEYTTVSCLPPVLARVCMLCLYMTYPSGDVLNVKHQM